MFRPGEVIRSIETLHGRNGDRQRSFLSESWRTEKNDDGSLFDELGRFLWMRQVGDMGRLHFDRLGLGALRRQPLLVWIDRLVLREATMYQVGLCFRRDS